MYHCEWSIARWCCGLEHGSQFTRLTALFNGNGLESYVQLRITFVHNWPRLVDFLMATRLSSDICPDMILRV